MWLQGKGLATSSIGQGPSYCSRVVLTQHRETLAPLCYPYANQLLLCIHIIIEEADLTL